VGASAFTIGYALDEPGGWPGLGIVAVWLAPLLLLAVMAWRWPRRAVPVLCVAAAAVVLLDVVALVVGADWGGFEDRVGPVRAIAAFTVAGPLAVLGLRHAVAAGWALLAIGAVPAALSMLVGPGSAPLLLIGVALTLAGLLYLLSSRFNRRLA
jgi:hypothetical protein